VDHWRLQTTRPEIPTLLKTALFPEGIEPRFRSELNEAHDFAKRVAKKIQESDGQSNHKMPIVTEEELAN
jgi:hypothetical protein